jgi:hypothetical protein
MYGGRAGGNYYNVNRRSFTKEYLQVIRINAMIDEAVNYHEEQYIALASFFRAYWFFNLTRCYGDIPFSEAARAKDEIFYPKYDKQEDIIGALLIELENANLILSENSNIKLRGDIIFNGNVLKWRKLINMFRLRILINCTQQETINGNSVQAMFADIVNNPLQNPIMDKLSDSAILYGNGNPNTYIYYNDNGFVSSYRMTRNVVEFMKDRGDKRLQKIAEPKINLSNPNISNLNNYWGVYPNPNINANENRISELLNAQSPLNKMWYTEIKGPSFMMAGYPEQEFILAEACIRKWISYDNAEDHYKNGIKASYSYFDIPTSDANTYVLNSKVRFLGSDTNTEKMCKIVTEKYMSNFFQANWESFFDMRRIGYPNFLEYLTNETNSIYNSGCLPMRWMYPQVEIDDNNEHVVDGINGLVPAKDDPNSRMWLLQGNDAYANPNPFPYHNYTF